MKKKYTLLSLDPMYSNLHCNIANLVADKKYAVTSCHAKRIYLKGFNTVLSTQLIGSIDTPISSQLIGKIKNIETYHHSYLKKVEKRELNDEEITYMAKFYLALKRYIKAKRVNLVLVHNDTRWYHQIALVICRELRIKYLVTELGLIRPYTTVVDNRGVNASANKRLIKRNIKKEDTEETFIPRSSHDSFYSMCCFFVFLSIFSIERIAKTKTIIRYMHNNYSLRKYVKRFVKVLKNKITANIRKRQPIINHFEKKHALLLMQLENDSQFLMYSGFQSNQEVIDRVAKQCEALKLYVKIKKHPLDTKKYALPENVSFTKGDVEFLSTKAEMVITINSSAIVSVLNTSTPLFIVGDSMFNQLDILTSCEIEAISQEAKQNIQGRQAYLTSLKNNYLLNGAGMSYCEKILNNKLKQLI